MPIISFISAKGGVGRTTSAIVLATTLAVRHHVALIDADPTKQVASWSRKAKLQPCLEVIASKGEQTLREEIEQARKKAEFVILDLGNAANRQRAYAMLESDLVIIPMGDERPDAEAAAETWNQLQKEGRGPHREIPTRILFTRTKDAKSPLETSLNAEIREQASCFQVELINRPAFSALHHYGGSLRSLDPGKVNEVPEAILCAERFSEEVKTTLQATDRTVIQMSLRMRKGIYDRFRGHCRTERRTNGEMLEEMMSAWERERRKGSS